MRFADPLGREAVPFTELVSLGGAELMRGYFPGRLIDRSAAVAALHYRWPIWVWLEAETRVAVGNAFGPSFAGLHAGALAGSWDVALRTSPGSFAVAELLVGVGTSAFESPVFAIDQVRILTRISRAF